MNDHEQLHILRQIVADFEDNNKLHQELYANFEIDFRRIVNETPGLVVSYTTLSSDLKTFSYSVINSINDILEKDKSSNPSLIKDELDRVELILANCPRPKDNNGFTARFAELTKKSIVSYFPAIYDLSADGLRMINQTTNFYVQTFLVYLLEQSHN